MNKPTLIAINEEIKNLALKRELILEEASGELTPEVEKALAEIEEQFKALLVQNKEKVSNYCTFLDSLDDEIKYCKERMDQVTAYVNSLKRSQDWLLNIAKTVITLTGEPLKGNYGNLIFTKKSTQTVIPEDPAKVPIEYQKMVLSVDKALIKERLKAGEVIEGCSLVEKTNVTWK